MVGGIIGAIVICAILWSIAPYVGVLTVIAVVVMVVIEVKKSREKPQSYSQKGKSKLLQSSEEHSNFNYNAMKSITPRCGETIYTKVVGVTFDGIQSVLPRLHAGMPLIFIREPNNQYDRNAVAVWCGGKKIGYLSRDLAADIAPQIDAGADVEGTIEAITGGNGKTYGCNIELTIYQK